MEVSSLFSQALQVILMLKGENDGHRGVVESEGDSLCLPPCLNTEWGSTSLRTTGAVLGRYLPTEAYLVFENDPRSLTLKTGRP